MFSFSLTRCQHILNPPQRLLFSFLGTLMFACGLAALIAALHTIPFLQATAVAIPACLGAVLISHRPARSLYSSVVHGQYINRIEIHKGTVRFGINGLDLALPILPDTRISRGWCATHIIRFRRGTISLVLPAHCIPLHELRQLLQDNSTELNEEP